MLNWLYEIVGSIILFWHDVWARVFSETSDAAWVLSIVFLTITVRVAIFPLFMKQVKSQRAVQLLAPQVKALQAKHKGDKETMNKEVMKLYKDNKANPLAGCFPLLLQMPIFFALFSVLRRITPERQTELYGIPARDVQNAADAHFFGAPIAATFRSPSDFVEALGATTTNVQVVAFLMVVAMGISTFITQKQMMARQAVAAEGPQAQVQKILLYVMPFSFAIFGFSFPVGVLLYWLTTNLWSMVQQQYVIRRMPPPGAVPPAPKGAQTPPSSDGGPSSSSSPGRTSTALADGEDPGPDPDPDDRDRGARDAMPGQRPAAPQPVRAANRKGHRQTGSRAKRKTRR